MKTQKRNLNSKNKTQKNKDKLIIHISGPSGSGKTTLGNKIKSASKDIVVKDLDDLFHAFMKNKKYKWGYQFDTSEYQEYINKYIKRNKKKHIIFVGLNLDMQHNPGHYYDIGATKKYYIKINNNIVFEQKCMRLINDIGEKSKVIIKEIRKNEKQTIEGLGNAFKFECGYKNIMNETEQWNNDYKKQGYSFLSREKIFEKIKSLI